MDLSLGVGPGSGPGSGRGPGSGLKTYAFHVDFILFTKVLNNGLCFFVFFHSKVIIWLEVCVSSGHFTRSF